MSRTRLGAAIALLITIFLAGAGKMLVIDAPEKSDIIVVLAGETERRPARGIELLRQGYARRMILDVPAREKVFEVPELQLAENYIRGVPEAREIGICAIEGLSTREEARDVEKCLAREQSRRVLVVTSDFHTRRALSIFRREIPGKVFYVAAVRDETQFGTKWWTHRQWAKTFFDEGLRWCWWKVVDQWR